MNISYYFKRNIALESNRLLLRKICMSDVEDMYDYSRRPETSRYLLWSSHSSISVTSETLKFILNEYENDRFHDFAVVLKSSGKMIGTTGFTSVDEKNACAEIGYVLNPDYHGQGIATEAVALLLNFAFCEVGFNRIEAKFMPENLPSRKVMEKCGMTFEGVLRSKMFIKGEFRNIGISSILSSEYFAVPRENIYAESKKPTFFERILGKTKKS